MRKLNWVSLLALVWGAVVAGVTLNFGRNVAPEIVLAAVERLDVMAEEPGAMQRFISQRPCIRIMSNILGKGNCVLSSTGFVRTGETAVSTAISRGGDHEFEEQERRRGLR